jgi:hypothetical protein
VVEAVVTIQLLTSDVVKHIHIFFDLAKVLKKLFLPQHNIASKTVNMRERLFAKQLGDYTLPLKTKSAKHRSVEVTLVLARRSLEHFMQFDL